MRILVLNHEFPPIGGGGGRAAEGICQHLAKRGHEIKVLTSRIHGSPHRELRDGFEIVRIPALRTKPFQAGFLSMATYVLTGLWSGFRLIRSFKPQVIHVHFAVPAGALAWMLSKLTGIPYILTAHLGDVPGGVPEKTRDWFRWVFPFTRSIWRDAATRVAVSEYTRELALQHYNEEIQVIPNGVDAAALKPRSLEIQDPPVIVFAGRFATQKAPVQVVRILHELKDLPWKCVMIGDGSLMPAVKKTIAELGIENRFELTGWVTPDEVMHRFEKSSILFMPSLSEGLPVVGVQALAKGLAIVASRVGGFVDLVEEGGNGSLLPANDARAMVDALRRFLTDRERLLQARARSLEIAQRFDLASISDAYEKLYEGVKNSRRKRLLIINSEYPPIGGGAGNASANLAQRLASLGQQVTVVTAQFKGLPRKETGENLEVIRIPAMRSRQDRTSAFELIVFILSALFWTLFLFAGGKSRKPYATIAFFGLPSGAVALMLRIFYKIPYIVSLRGGDVPGFRPYDFGLYHKIMRPLLRKIWKSASVIVANSRGLRDLALQFDSRFEIPIIPNGVDAGLFHATAQEDTTPRIFSVGRIVHQKGLDLAMHALSGLKDLEWEWRIAGDGPQVDMLKSLASNLGMENRVRFLGWQSHDLLTGHYAWANLFLFPSRHEGMPNAVLEAMASGLPVIASRISGNEELVVDGETGLLVPSEDVDSLRDALRRLILDASLRGRMGVASRRRVEDSYNWESVAQQYALLLERVE
jgi:glycosyltransferase involved in cell wall biosynthesis